MIARQVFDYFDLRFDAGPPPLTRKGIDAYD